MPWHHFWFLYGAIWSIEATRRLTAAQAIAQGLAYAMAKPDDPKVQELTDMTLRQMLENPLPQVRRGGSRLVGPDGQPL